MNILKSIKYNLYNYINLLRSFFHLIFEKKKIFLINNLKTKINLDEIFGNEFIEKNFIEDNKIINNMSIPEFTSGVNQGDRRAIYYLISFLKPKQILEIGTHIGSSTLGMALASNQNGQANHIDTVDIIDVNDEKIKHWLKFNSKNSPKNIINQSAPDQSIKFFVSKSDDFFKNNNKKYDFIFLDGSHRSNVVYNEISFALENLQTEGLILLHDYFPNGNPIWDGKKIIFGPYMALKRILNEKNQLKIHALDNLPWTTKFDTNKSSLAILTKQ